MNNIAIRVQNLTKRYRIGLKEDLHDTFGGMLIDWIKSPAKNFRRLRRLTSFDDKDEGGSIRDETGNLKPEDCKARDETGNLKPEESNTATPQVSGLTPQVSSFTPHPSDVIFALRDVSFEVKRGEVVGIIGRNGAGKSTLLKILSRIVEPTSGRAEIHGRVASLLEVGTGFHQELTGRENVYLNGTILGMTKREVDSKFDEIVDFSGVEKFIDTPVKRYSSGMRVRLAFAVAAHLEPEILLVDEVLAVGDAEFQKKCLGKMEEVAGHGRTVLFVSHNMGAVRSLCKETLLLVAGQMVRRGATDEVLNEYLNTSSTGDNVPIKERIDRNGSGVVRLTNIAVLPEQDRNIFYSDMGVRIILHYESEDMIKAPRVVFSISDHTGIRIYWLDSQTIRQFPTQIYSRGIITCTTGPISVTSGFCKVNVAMFAGGALCDHVVDAAQFKVEGAYSNKTVALPERSLALCSLNHRWEVS